MNALETNLVQVAGVMDQAEADMLQECGVRYLGIPLRLPVHTEDLSEDDAAKIFRGLRSGVHGVLITYLDQAPEISAFCRAMGVTIVQLHGDISPQELKVLRQLQPRLTMIKSLVVGQRPGLDLTETVDAMAEDVDAFITDTFDPKTGASGATGMAHDWDISRRLVEYSPRPVILAGGLNALNVRVAIEQVRPAGVDAHTGLEATNGRKDRSKVEQFLAEARDGFRALQS